MLETMLESTTMSMNLTGSRKPSKTLDVGFNGVSLSTDSLGTILQISVFHPKHGIVLAEPYEQFDSHRFRDTQYVRAYRARMLKSIKTGVPGFGLRFDVHALSVQVDLDGLGRAVTTYNTENRLLITTSLRLTDDGQVIQSSKITSSSDSITSVRCIMDFGISVNRASYGQLTEGGPIPLPKSENRISVIDNGLGFLIVNPHLSAHFQGSLEDDGNLVDFRDAIREQSFIESPVKSSYSHLLEIPPGTSRTLTARFTLRPGVTYQGSGDKRKVQSVGFPTVWPTPEKVGRFIVRRNLEYILGNCTIPLAPSKHAVCLLTDHVALPLGWMRDNYWQVRFLIDVYQNLNELADARVGRSYSQVIKDTVKGHLIWIFRYAQRPHQFWHRSYLTTGRPKDGALFQLDQQCYPLLEICDFWETFPEEQGTVEEIMSTNVIDQVLNLIESRRDPATGLISTDETPADDAVEYPFHFSSHVLLWHALSRLAKMSAELAQSSRLKKRVTQLAEQVRASTMKYFLCLDKQPERPVFSYLVDGHGNRSFYHDANDLPTLFAPTWGFVQSDIEKQAWHNTMDFAFSAENEGGYYGEGMFGGLGSVHTRGPWPLGYFQGWRYAQMTGDTSRESDDWRKICGAMLWDGTFSEAVDSHTGECTSKAWFSWPGSMIGSGLLQPGIRERYL